MSDLDNLTTNLGKAYAAWKKSEQQKNKAKEAFFAEAIKHTEEQTLAQVTVPVEGVLAEDEVPAWVDRMYPTWRLVEVKREDDDTLTALIEEDPFYKPFAYINPKDSKVYERQVASGSSYLDDETLRTNDPELWEEITHDVRQLRPLESLDAGQLAAIQKYIRHTKPTVKLAAPRKAKPEELAELDEDDN